MTPEWTETFVDDLLDWSFLSFDDLPELAELRAAMEYYDDPVQTMGYEDLVADWDRPYSREQGCFPPGAFRIDKYWPPVGRVDNAYGDRHLVCSCPPWEPATE
mgnify:CR=1 FL=1